MREAEDLYSIKELRESASVYKTAADRYLRMGYGERALDAYREAMRTILLDVENAALRQVYRWAHNSAELSNAISDDILKGLPESTRTTEGYENAQHEERAHMAHRFAIEADLYLKEGNIGNFYYASKEAVYEDIDDAQEALEKGDFKRLKECTSFIEDRLKEMIRVEIMENGTSGGTKG